MSQPWINLQRANDNSLRRLAIMLSAVKKNPLSNEDDGFLFGETGYLVAKEIYAHLEARATGKEIVSADKEEEIKEEEPLVVGEDMSIIRAFKDKFLSELGIAAPIKYGRDRKVIQGLLKGGQKADTLTELIPVFFACKDRGYLFRNGTIVDFANAIAQLQVERMKSIPTKTQVPVGVFTNGKG